MALVLILGLALVSVAGTVGVPSEEESGPRGVGSVLARAVGVRRTFSSPPFLTLVGLLGANVAVCTWHRARARAGSADLRLGADVGIHVGLLVLMAGGLAKALFGFIGTQNIYVGGTTSTVYDWRGGRDAPLGFVVAVEQFRSSFHPVRAKVGLRRAATGEKIALVEVVEGGQTPTPAGDLRISIAGYDGEGGGLRLGLRGLGAPPELSFATDGTGAPARVGDYELTLVAYRADLKEVAARISLVEGGARVAGGWLDSRTRLKHRGLSIFFTAWGTDPEGRRYCGVQVVRDPGALLFWIGSTLFALATTAHVVLRVRRSG